ncbi:MAG: VOC family protein [Chloroflexi bacterium]|nr:VOC family protein [Chloroflexota bacterium]
MKPTSLLALGALGTAAVAVRQKVRPAEPLAYKPGLDAPVPARLQHAVFYVRDLERSREFYQDIFDLQFSARNHQDSSAAMRLAGLNMMFFSFGEMHHDICFVLNTKGQVDNEAWLGFSVALRPGRSLADIEERLEARGVAFTPGRVLPVESAARRALFFRDPDGHVIEVVEATHG